ncbi:hypothetical protein DPX16_12195, partial [Anabarilius grahami]
VLCLGKSHAEAALTETTCSHCESMSLASLRSPLAPSREPVRKKQRGRGSQRSDESELMSAQVLRASLSPHREASPIHFSRPGQRPSAIASDLVSFGGSDEEPLDDSMFLAALDAEEWSGSLPDPAPLPSLKLIDARASIDSKHTCVLSKAVEQLGL